MTIDDLPGVFRLGERLFTLKGDPTLYRTWDEYELINFYSGDSGYCLIAEIDGGFGGFCLGTIIDKRNTPHRYGYLVWLGVAEKYQNCGVGRKLFAEFKRIMIEDGATRLLVDTSANNVNALRFFNSMGFHSPQDHVYLSMKCDERNL